MVKVFDTISDFEAYVLGGMNAGDLYYVKEDDSVHFRTNNIDGSDKDYSMSAEGGEGDDAVLIEGEFTSNGTYTPEEADGYSEVVVNVPIPEGYIVPTGSKSITANGEAIDVAAYATVNVNVAGETPQYTTAVLPSDYTALPININAGQTIEIHSISTNRFSMSLVDSNGENIYSGIESVPFYLTNALGNISGIMEDSMSGATIEYRIF